MLSLTPDSAIGIFVAILAAIIGLFASLMNAIIQRKDGNWRRAAAYGFTAVALLTVGALTFFLWAARSSQSSDPISQAATAPSVSAIPSVQTNSTSAVGATEAVNSALPNPSPAAATAIVAVSITDLPPVTRQVQTDIPTALSEPTPMPTRPKSPTPCKGLEWGETRNVEPGTYIIGDVSVDGVDHYDKGGSGEGTVVYLERPAQVYADRGAECLIGDESLMTSMIDVVLRSGCGSSCRTARAVTIKAVGDPATEFYPK